jgi:glycosyltransferase involved in cell wall biosynthesis
MISVLILTYNEEQDLPACLDSVSFSDDIHVFDSNSTDKTQQIAKNRGAHLHTRAFDNYAAQRNAAMQLPFAHPWVLVLDADERPTPALIAEIAQILPKTPETTAAYRIRRRDFLWGTWLKHAQLSPFYVRLVRAGRVHYTRDVNEVAEIAGDIGQLTEPFNHLPFSKGIAHWVAKHNDYSTREAEVLANGDFAQDASLHEALFGRDFHTRRIAQKAIFYQLPGRPVIKWLYMMFFRGAVLDGHAGIMYATLQSLYEYLIEIKHRELLRRRTGKPL